MSAKKAAADKAVPSLASLPTVTEFLFAALDITAAERQRVSEMAGVYGIGSQQFEEWLDRFMAERASPVRILVLINKVKADLKALVSTGHGPTESDMVDLA